MTLRKFIAALVFTVFCVFGVTTNLQAAPALVYSKSLSNTLESGNNFKINYGGASGAGTLGNNLLTLRMTYPHGATVSSITDNKSSTYTSGATTDSGSWVTTIYYVAGSASGITLITVNFGASVADWHAAVEEYSGVALTSPTDGTCNNHTTSVQCSAAITTGTSGDLIVATAMDVGNGGNFCGGNTTAIAPGGSFFLDAADPYCADADEEYTQPSSGAITPSFTFTGNTHVFNTVAIAFKPAAVGTNPTGMYILHQQTIQINESTASQPNYFVSAGNLIVASVDDGNTNAGGNIVTITGCSPSNTFTKVSPSGTNIPQIFYSASATPSTGLHCTVNSGMPTDTTLMVIYDIVGAAASPLDKTTASASGSGATITVPPITPSAAPGIAFAVEETGNGPSSAVGSGAIYDNTPYTGETDSSKLNNGDGWQHYFYSSTATINMTWTQVNTGSSYSTFGISFKAAAAPPPVSSANAYINLNLTTPSAPGTQLTSTIWGNGLVGSLSGWASSGTAANMTVGLHQPLCSLQTTVTNGGNTYAPGLLSQSFAMNMAAANTFWTANYTGGNNKIAISFCLKLPTSASNVMDIVSIQDASQFSTWLQIGSGATTMDIEVTPSPTSGTVAVTPGATYWVTMLDDESAGIAKFAVYQPYYPYAQVGTTQSHSQTTSTSITAVRFGNAEAGTSSSTMNMENIILDSTNATFPLVPTLSTPWAPILSPTRAIDWSKAGVTGGIPTRTTICTTLGTAGQASSFVQSVTAAQIVSAINACPANDVVYLNAGTYNLTGQVTFTNIQNVTLRGAGADKTQLVFSGVATTCGSGLPTSVCIRATDGNYSGGPSNTANWTAGYLPETTTITLSAVPNLSIGHYIILDQLDDTAFGCDSGKVLVTDITTACTHGSPVSPGINGPYSGDGNGGGARTGRGQQQIVKVTQCDGTSTVGHVCTSGANITISPGLYMANWNWSPGNNLPQAWWATSPSQGDGVENLTVNNTSNGANTDGCSGGAGIGFYNATDSWMSGVRDIASVKAHVEFNWSAHITAQNSYLYLTQNAGSTGGTSGNPTGCAYGFESFSASDVLVQNNITQAVATPYILNGPCDGCVFAYNYSTFDMYLGTSLYASNSQGDHDAGNSNVLVEGNIGATVNADDTHGTHNLITYYRNRWVGVQTCWQSSTNVSTTALAISTGTFSNCTQNISPFILNSFSRFFNIAGNILGTTGLITTYLNTGSNPVLSTGQGNASYGTANDVNTTTTLLLWGNCDSANGFGSCRFVNSEVPSSLANQGQSYFANPVPANNNLPASFYNSSKPVWWPINKAWPIIGPDVTGGNLPGVNGTAYTNPANDCYNAIGGPANGVGTVLTFNANTCYSPSSSVIPAAPTNLTVAGQ